MSSKNMRTIMETLESPNKVVVESKPISNQIKSLIREGYENSQILGIISKSPVLAEESVRILSEWNFDKKKDENKDDKDCDANDKDCEDKEEDEKKEAVKEGIAWVNDIAHSAPFTVIIETTKGTTGRKTFSSRQKALEWISAKQDQIASATAIEFIFERGGKSGKVGRGGDDTKVDTKKKTAKKK